MSSGEVKFDARKDFAYGRTTTLALPEGGSISVTVSSDGKSLSFLSDTTVFGLVVKGGTEANMYNYFPYRRDNGR